MGFISSWITWYLKRRLKQIEFYAAHPIETQKNTFIYLLNQASKTEWGEKYKYSKIKNITQFKEQVPVSTYEAIFPYIDRTLKGEQNLLWPTPIHWFAKSSGTTNDRSKFIPVSKESLHGCHFKGGKDLITLYLNNKVDSKVLHGKGLAIGGSYQANPGRENSYYGDVSAVIMKNLPAWAQYLRTPSIDIALMSKWEEKIEKIASVAIPENITSISGVPTWMIVLLQRILQKTGAKSVSEVWPNLEVFLHGAVSFTPYRRLFKDLIPSISMSYLETYNASEGFFGIQDDLSLQDQMMLMLDYGMLYEFLPLEQVGQSFPKTLSLEEVEVGKNYAMIISTNAGLWRYLIGDTIRFTNTKPFRIQVTGRTKHFINAFGEELVIENADHALETACKATSAILKDYTAAPVYMENGKKGCHEWLLEFEKTPDDMERFAMLLDETLRRINSDYDAKRYLDMALVAPQILVLPKGTFYTWLASKNKLGGQHKVPRLSNTREYVDQILALLPSGV